jgi:hypothetical protein
VAEGERFDVLGPNAQERLPYIVAQIPTNVDAQIDFHYRMYKPVAAWIDLGAIFDPPNSALAEKKDICKRWRKATKSSFILCMEDCIDLRLRWRAQQLSNTKRHSQNTGAITAPSTSKTRNSNTQTTKPPAATKVPYNDPSRAYAASSRTRSDRLSALKMRSRG